MIMMLERQSRSFNPLIAKAFFWIKYIEEVGTGTNKIIEWCKDWGIAEPDFEYAGSSVVVTLRKSKLTEEYLTNLGLNERELKIIEQIKANKKTTSGEIQKLFNVRRKAANSYLKRLIDLKLIKRMGSGKAVYYVLTAK